MDSSVVAAEIDARLRQLSPGAKVPEIRAVRREYSGALRKAPAPDVMQLARTLLARYGHRSVAYELLHQHRPAFRRLTPELVEELGSGMASWGETDCFGAYISGPAWHAGLVGDDLIHSWARSPDRWWRRAALVSCVYPRGDTKRTLTVCRMLASDRDDMVVKAMSWALRELVRFDRAAVEGFLAEHDGQLAARAKREVRHKLDTGLKYPRRVPAG
ncbi:MAG: DNA alkylation repair protein [Bacillota bacterium]|nr:DNA alkylation repair protein [Bacillota bacterium]